VQARAAAHAGLDIALLAASLETFCGREARLVERFYALFFGRHPDVRALFGEHGISEREEMIRETLASVLALALAEPWLGENLTAMGRSHAEYGVEGPMYDAFVDCMLDALEDVAGPDWAPGSREAWHGALGQITETMRRAAS